LQARLRAGLPLYQHRQPGVPGNHRPVGRPAEAPAARGTKGSPIMSRTAAPSAAERGARWLIGRQKPDGSLEGAIGLGDYYKAPFGLAVTGHHAEADRMLGHVARTFLKADGDLDGTGVAWFDTFRIYPHAWLAVAALMRGRFEIAFPLLDFLSACHDERTGG